MLPKTAQECIREMAKARLQHAEAIAVMRILEDAVKSSPEWIAANSLCTSAIETAALARDQIEILALEAYNGYKEKHLHPAVEIKMSKNVVIPDPNKILPWIKENFTPALSYHKPTFEKAVKDGLVPADIAALEEKPKVYVSTDLSAYLDAGEPTELPNPPE